MRKRIATKHEQPRKPVNAEQLGSVSGGGTTTGTTSDGTILIGPGSKR